MMRNKSSKPKFGHRPMVILPLALLILSMSVGLTQGTWSNEGEQELDIDQDNYSMEESRYVAPGHTIRFDVYEIIENDTNTPDDCNDPNGTEYEEDDPQKQARLIKTGGTVSDNWEEPISSTGPVYYTVPADACAGQTITIESQLHDTRDANDDRHDDWTTFETWEYTVSTDCPDSMSVAAMDDISGGRPNAGETFGEFRATMEAEGDPPAGRENWNGTTVTESVGVAVGDANEWIPGIIGSPCTSGSSFTFGSAGDNQFYDWHSTDPPDNPILLLAADVNSASYTRDQTYTCSPEDEYDFTITHTGNRLDPNTANERIKMTITKN